MENRKRQNQVKVRLDGDEMAALGELHTQFCADGRVTKTDFIRGQILNNLPPRVPEFNRAVFGELVKIGINLNQIAHQINTAGLEDRVADIDFSELKNQIQRLKKHLLFVV